MIMSSLPAIPLLDAAGAEPGQKTGASVSKYLDAVNIEPAQLRRTLAAAHGKHLPPRHRIAEK